MQQFVLVEVLDRLYQYEDVISLTLVCKSHLTSIPSLLEHIVIDEGTIVKGSWLPLIGRVKYYHDENDCVLSRIFFKSYTNLRLRTARAIVSVLDHICIQRWRDVLGKPYNNTDKELLKLCMMQLCDRQYQKTLISGSREECLRLISDGLEMRAIDQWVIDDELRDKMYQMISYRTRVESQCIAIISSSASDESVKVAVGTYINCGCDIKKSKAISLLCTERPQVAVELIKSGKLTYLPSVSTYELYLTAKEYNVPMGSYSETRSWKVHRDEGGRLSSLTPSYLRYLAKCKPHDSVLIYSYTLPAWRHSIYELYIAVKSCDKTVLVGSIRCVVVSAVLNDDKYVMKLLRLLMDKGMLESNVRAGVMKDLEDAFWYANDEAVQRIVTALRIIRQ